MTDSDDTETAAATLDQLADLVRQAGELAFSLRASWAGLNGDEVNALDTVAAVLDLTLETATEARSQLLVEMRDEAIPAFDRIVGLMIEARAALSDVHA